MATDGVAAYWDDQAATFDDAADHGLRDPSVRRAWRALLGSVLPEAPAEIADLGCGTGSLSLLMAEAGHRVSGIDVSDRMVAAAQAKADLAHISTTFRQGDAAEPKLAPDSIDVIVVRHVTWALPDPGAAVARWRTILRDAGRLVLIEGQWSTGVGLKASQLEAIVRPTFPNIETSPLTDPQLWGGPITDERYLLVASV